MKICLPNPLKRCSRQFNRLIRGMVLGLLVTLAIANIAAARSTNWTTLSSDLAQGQILPSTIAQSLISGTSESPGITGNILLTETSAGLKVSGTLNNAPPGIHGFHIHEGNSCDDNGMAAGGHFNPAGMPHGHLLTDGLNRAHAGDFGNIWINDYGTAILDQTFPGLTVQKGSQQNGYVSVVGRTFILHADADDFSQPTGNAGKRIACGVISTLP
jgi:Cu-Zn family superoxide dismutase